VRLSSLVGTDPQTVISLRNAVTLETKRFASCFPPPPPLSSWDSTVNWGQNHRSGVLSSSFPLDTEARRLSIAGEPVV